MPANGDLYVFTTGGDGEGEAAEWASPRPVDEAVVDVVTAATDLSEADVGALDEYVDRDDLAAYLAGEPADEPLTFDVEGHEVVVEPDGTIDAETA